MTKLSRVPPETRTFAWYQRNRTAVRCLLSSCLHLSGNLRTCVTGQAFIAEILDVLQRWLLKYVFHFKLTDAWTYTFRVFEGFLWPLRPLRTTCANKQVSLLVWSFIVLFLVTSLYGLIHKRNRDHVSFPLGNDSVSVQLEKTGRIGAPGSSRQPF